jgi:hypothetical protein
MASHPVPFLSEQSLLTLNFTWAAKIMVCMEERQLLTQPRFVFAQGVDSRPDRRHMLANIQIQALDKGGVDLPTPLRQDGFDGRCQAKNDAVLAPDEVPAPVTLDHLRIE